MKLILLSVACLVAVCSAIPPRPMIPETFCGMGEVEYHEAKQTRFGNFSLCHDQTKQMEGLNCTFDDKSEFRELLRYDMTPNHMAYYLRGEGMAPENCIAEKRNVTTKLPPFFDWVKIASFEGVRKIMEMEYDIWGLSAADFRLELAVKHSDTVAPAVPAFFNHRAPESNMLYGFNPEKFKPTAPSKSTFDVPKQCTK